MVRLRSPAPIHGSVPEWPKGADCKSVVCDFGGPNPPAPTKKKSRVSGFFFLYSSLFSILFSLFSSYSPRLFQRKDKREERKDKITLLLPYRRLVLFVLFVLHFSLIVPRDFPGEEIRDNPIDKNLINCINIDP